MTILKATNVVKQFAGHRALSGVSIEAQEGEIFGLLGPNGAGKTTLIRIINQITAPDEGNVFFADEPLLPKHIQHIGYLPEERGLYQKMKVGELVLYLARLKGLSRTEAQAKIKHWFEKFEIQAWYNKKINELSKGMQQKVQFITTVLHNPRLLIFDEPFSGFDPINANLLKNEILELKKSGCSVIFSTHNMESVEELCDRIALINKSEKILDGSIRDIKKQYSSETYEIVYKNRFNVQQASLSAQYEILNTEKSGENQVLTLRLKDDLTSNQLIYKMMDFGEVISFREILPTMNDIFIRTVEEKNKQTGSLANN